jgi:plasmid stabilization system protein ParE
MKRFVLTRPAERDLDQIKSYLVEQAGARVARRILKEIRSAMTLVGSDPGVGHLRDDLTSRPVKFWPVYSLPDRLRSRDQASTRRQGAARHA